MSNKENKEAEAKVVNKSESKLSFRVINKTKNVLAFRQVTIDVGGEHELSEDEQLDDRLMAKIKRASKLNMVDLVK